MVVKMTIGTNLVRKDVVVEDTLTPNEVLEQNDVSTEFCTMYLSGYPLTAGEMSKPLHELGVTEKATLLGVHKVDNANI